MANSELVNWATRCTPKEFVATVLDKLERADPNDTRNALRVIIERVSVDQHFGRTGWPTAYNFVFDTDELVAALGSDRTTEGKKALPLINAWLEAH